MTRAANEGVGAARVTPEASRVARISWRCVCVDARLRLVLRWTIRITFLISYLVFLALWQYKQSATAMDYLMLNTLEPARQETTLWSLTCRAMRRMALPA